MIKRPKTKAEIRDEINRDINRYLSDGGAVKDIPNGVSGREDNTNLFSQATQFEPKQERTPVTEVIKELEARKKGKNEPARKKSGPRKKLITDDFGEPIRWVWEE